MIKKNNCRGISIIELIVVLSISSILMFVVSVIITNTITSWKKGFNKMDLMRDADCVVAVIEKCLREGVESEILNMGKKISIADRSGGIESIWQDGSTIFADLKSGTTFYVSGNVESLKFSVAATTYTAVAYEMILKENNQEYKINSIIKHRSKF